MAGLSQGRRSLRRRSLESRERGTAPIINDAIGAALALMLSPRLALSTFCDPLRSSTGREPSVNKNVDSSARVVWTVLHGPSGQSHPWVGVSQKGEGNEEGREKRAEGADGGEEVDDDGG